MIKRLIVALVVALPLLASAQSKFGVVNVEELTRAMPEYAKVQEEIAAINTKLTEEAKGLEAEIQKKYDEFQALAPDTPDAIKQRRQQEIEELAQKYQQFRATANQNLSHQTEILVAPVQQKVQRAIQTVGEAGGFTFIFYNEMPIFTGKDVIDVTPKVKTELGL